jgi:hypothetical protein
MLTFLNMADEYSRVCLANRVCQIGKAVEVIDTIKGLLRLYPGPTHLQMDNVPGYIAHALQEYRLSAFPVLPTRARFTLGESMLDIIQHPILG